MQITLNQVEIEQAITDLIHTQFNVKEGIRVVVSLKMTRGEEGNTAIVDLIPESKIVEEPVVTQAAPVVTKERTVIRRNKPNTETPATTQVTQETAVAVVEPEVEIGTEVAEDLPLVVDEDVTDLEPEAEPEAEPEPEVDPANAEPEVAEDPVIPSKPATSLFAGLGKVKNS